MKIIIALLLISLTGCVPVFQVNVQRRHHIYELSRRHTYTTPVWIPGKGTVLVTHILPKQTRPVFRRRGHK